MKKAVQAVSTLLNPIENPETGAAAIKELLRCSTDLLAIKGKTALISTGNDGNPNLLQGIGQCRLLTKAMALFLDCRIFRHPSIARRDCAITQRM